MKIVVLAGGASAEREVSLTSGALICAALRQRNHQALVVDLCADLLKYEEEPGHYFIDLPDIPKTKVEEQEPDLLRLKENRDFKKGLFGKNVLEICRSADIVFIGLHGEDGENGKVQAVFDCLGIRYTGSGYLASALAMDKRLTKNLLKQESLLVPKDHLLKNLSEWHTYQEEVSYPVVIKPNDGGSSLGVTIAKTADEADKGINEAFLYSREAIVEEFISGREFSVGFIGDRILPAVEIKPRSGFYDYKNKYQIGMTEEICPPAISHATHQKLKDLTWKVKSILKLEVYGRIDFIMDQQNSIYILEANSLPGMTPTSLVPIEAKAENWDFSEVCQTIIELSLKKYL